MLPCAFFLCLTPFSRRPSLSRPSAAGGFFDGRADVWEMILMGVQVVLQEAQ